MRVLCLVRSAAGKYVYSPIWKLALLTLVPATGGKTTPSAVFAKKSPNKQRNKTIIFRDIVTDPFGLPKQLSVLLYLLPVLRGRSGSNVHETGFATISNECL